MQPPNNGPLITFLPPQEEVFWSTLRILFMLWRRQFGKSYTIGGKAMSRMMTRRNHSVFVVSASILMAQENIRKEVEVWNTLMDAYRKLCEAKNLKLTSNADGLDIDAVAEMFESSKLETRIWHSNTNYSRTRVVAPNPQTARGFSGDVFGDEIGFWPDFEGVFDAVEPIISRNPEWILWMATTPPKDDTHPVYDLLNPGEVAFPANARGNWFETESGYPVHRLDAYDGDLAGLPMFHPRTGKPCSVQEARDAALNKINFDRNYLLKFTASGSAAISRQAILAAQARGKDTCCGFDITDSIQAA